MLVRALLQCKGSLQLLHLPQKGSVGNSARCNTWQPKLNMCQAQGAACCQALLQWVHDVVAMQCIGAATQHLIVWGRQALAHLSLEPPAQC